MENTNCGDKCSFVKSGFCNSDCECPFYIESIWESKGEPKVIKDCSPKRMMLEQNRMTNHFIGVQSSVQVLRDKVENLEKALVFLISRSKELMVELDKENLKLEKKETYD